MDLPPNLFRIIKTKGLHFEPFLLYAFRITGIFSNRLPYYVPAHIYGETMCTFKRHFIWNGGKSVLSLLILKIPYKVLTYLTFTFTTFPKLIESKNLSVLSVHRFQFNVHLNCCLDTTVRKSIPISYISILQSTPATLSEKRTHARVRYMRIEFISAKYSFTWRWFRWFLARIAFWDVIRFDLFPFHLILDCQ